MESLATGVGRLLSVVTFSVVVNSPLKQIKRNTKNQVGHEFHYLTQRAIFLRLVVAHASPRIHMNRSYLIVFYFVFNETDIL